jgi:peptidoglycan biosynthesis protein MviN/MurJ (putative lipid II flippase)
MFQVGPVVVVFGYVVIALVGGIVGLVVGILSYALKRNRIRTVFGDTLLGGIGSVVTVIACAIMPWPRNTVSKSLSPGIRVESTLNRFQHPYIAAVLVAALLPALNEWVRAKRQTAGQKQDSQTSS